MMLKTSALIIVVLAVFVATEEPQEIIIGITKRHYEATIFRYPEETTNNLAASLDWGWHSSKNGDQMKNFLSTARNQHSPMRCASCYAHAIAAMMTDRIYIEKDGVGQEHSVGIQMLMDCSYNQANYITGCKGGDIYETLLWLENNYVHHESCRPYASISQGKCDLDDVCSDKDETGRYRKFSKDSLYKYKIKKGSIRVLTEKYDPLKKDFPESEKIEIIKRNELNIMAELLKGPVSCGTAVNDIFKVFQGSQIYTDKTLNSKYYVHGVTIVGYGEENGVKFWNVRNSYGDPWGKDGFFRVERGKGILNIELYCVGADVEIIAPTNSQQLSAIQHMEKSKIESKRILLEGELPESFDWRTNEQGNVLSWTTTQHLTTIPEGSPTCGSCWAFGSIGAFNDRVNILLNKKKYPDQRAGSTFQLNSFWTVVLVVVCEVETSNQCTIS